MGICFSSKSKNVDSSNKSVKRYKQSTLIKTKSKREEDDISNLKIDFIKEGQGEITKNYRIESKILGQGSYGEVRKALHIPTKELRAIKIIKKSICPIEELENILREIQILKEADHPGIVKIYEYFNTTNALYICMEVVLGMELFDKLMIQKEFNETLAADVISQLLEAVNFLHSLNIVHRDLKPENIMMEGNSLKLIDFGTSLKYEEKLTTIIGTAYYIAPEVLENNYNEKCDVWSCGVILYILLSGEPPFNGEDDNAILESVKKGKFNFNQPIWKKISNDAKEIIREMLTYSPKRRPSAGSLLKHDWIVKNTPKIDCEFKKEHFENILKFEFKNKLQESLYLFIINNLVTKDERKELAQVFRKLDSNHDGTLSSREIKNGFDKVGIKLNDEEVKTIITRLDLNNDKVIGFTEFLSAAFNKKQLLNKERVQLCFSIFDSDGSGKISVEELKKIFYSSDNGESEIWKVLLQQADENGDGEIEYDEFEKILHDMIK